MESKTCRKCQITKEIYFFHKNGVNTHGIQQYKAVCTECRKPIIKEQAKTYRAKHKDEIEAKAGEKLKCNCGMKIRRDWLNRHKKSVCHQDLLKQKDNLKRDLTDEEIDAFLHEKYPFKYLKPIQKSETTIFEIIYTT